MNATNLIPISEIFGPTIQGEGPNAGMKCIFIRVAGCDFKCDFCDSKFSWIFNKDTAKYSSEELINIILEKCKNTHTSHVILTGGNPCLYDFELFIEEMYRNHIRVDIETQGSILPNWLIDCDTIVISPKPPSSKQKDVYSLINLWLDNNEYIPETAIKIPIFDLVDFNFALNYNQLIKSYRDKHNVKLYLSIGNTNTMESGDISSRILMDYKNLIDIVMNSELDDVYILPQIHTLIWGNKQGV